MLNSRFNARGKHKRSARLLTLVLLISCAWSCKSWGKFWAIYTPGEAKPLYAVAPLWNDYIAADGTALTVRGVSANAPSGVSSRLNASGTACNSAATGGYGVCIHAGLMRQSVINDKEDCSGISASDTLGAFTWVCDASVKPVRLIAVGFNDGKYMTDLIDFDAVRFRSNALTVIVDGVSYTSPSTVWWANPVSNFSATLYGSASEVVLVQSNPNSGAIITNNADKTALLVRPGVKITTTSASGAINDAGKHFSWFEGTIDLNGATGGTIGLAISNGNFVVIQNFAILNSGTTPNAAFQVNGNNLYYRDVRYANATQNSMRSFDLLAGYSGNVLHGVIATNDEFSAQIKSTDSVILNMTSANSGNGANVNVDFQTGAANNALLNFTSANNGTAGGIGAIRTSDGANHTLMNIAVANTPNPGYSGAGTATGRQLINLAFHTSATPSFLVSSSTFTYVSGIVKLAFGTCTAGGVDTGITAACGTQAASDFTLTSTALNPATAFVGRVLTDDSVNTSDGNGLATYAVANDWVNFSNRYRGYGLENVAAFPNTLHQRRCTTGPNCRIWDWSLQAGDAEYRNLLAVPNGNNTAAHKWSAVTQITCKQPGAVWYGTGTCQYPPFTSGAGTCSTWTGGVTTNAACLTTFLRNAYEIIGDGIGNENGLCESNEACIYTPNIASYQGHGSLTCIRGPAEYGCASAFSDGTISGVILYQYANNGY